MSNITQEMFNLVSSPYRSQIIRCDILNYNFQTVDEISGNIVNGSLSINANADIRRTVSISMQVTDSSFSIKSGGKIWLDKYIRLNFGLEDMSNGNIEWINLGVYLIDEPSWNYSTTNNTLSFSGLDLMSKMTGLRNGQLEGIPTLIPQGSNIREVIIATVTQLGGFKNYAVDECISGGVIVDLPYDITIKQGGTVYDILSELRDIIPSYQIYFDVEGTFFYNKIPTGENEPIFINDDILEPLLINESVSISFSDVKNLIEVWGASLDTAYYNDATVSDDTYVVEYASMDELNDDILYGFTAPSIVVNPKLKVNDLNAYPILNKDGSNAIIPKADEYYVVMWDGEKNAFEFMGYQQPHAISKDTNPDSPFYINGTVGAIREVLYGGNYDNIYSNDLAQQRADYELWKATRLNDKITLSCVPIPFLDVNVVISHLAVDSTTSNEYIVKNVSMGLGIGDTMTIEAIKYYQEYPTI